MGMGDISSRLGDTETSSFFRRKSPWENRLYPPLPAREVLVFFHRVRLGGRGPGGDQRQSYGAAPPPQAGAFGQVAGRKVH